MIMLALPLPSIAVVSFDHRCATPIPHVVTGRPGSSPHRSYSKQASNARRQQTASIEIPIASDAHPATPPAVSSFGGLRTPAPGVRRATIMGPASANLVWDHCCQVGTSGVILMRHEIALGMTGPLLGCAERSKPRSRVRRAKGAGLDRECADRATIIVAATREFRPARPIDDGFLFCRISFHQY
jgi:hypothetical protein